MVGKVIVLDVVFKAGSLNYDEGSGNYQPLKKITGYDGRQYTFVSRYALRYSMLHDSGVFSNKELAPGKKFTETRGEGGGGSVIQPKPELLFNGEILKYPEFDLFGYLITETTPQNWREAPVKISHAISLTPYNLDTHFSASHDWPRRYLKAVGGQLNPNPYILEEHHTYYAYTVVIDVDRIGKIDVYYDPKKHKSEAALVEGARKNEMIMVKGPEQVGSLVKVTFELKDTKERINRILKVIKAITHLKRNIKGRSEDLTPHLLILGLYENRPYETYKDAIRLERSWEEVEEIETREEDNKTIRIKRVIVREIPKFKLNFKPVPVRIENENKEYRKEKFSGADDLYEKVEKIIEAFLNGKIIPISSKNKNKGKKLKGVLIFYKKGIEIEEEKIGEIK